MEQLKIELENLYPILIEEVKRVMKEIFDRMAGGEDEIYFADLTQGMWDIKTQLDINLTTIKSFGTFYLYRMKDTRKCAIYKWKNDHLGRVDNRKYS